MTNPIKLITYLTLFLLAALTACHPHGESWHRLSQADSIMESHPDSALAILRTIDRSSLSGDEQRARYALLMSMALDKNYIDTTSFDILQPAIDYYLKKGNPDERLRTLYYRGVIFLNRHEDNSAMNAFLDALDLRKSVTDSLTLARIIVAQGTLYPQLYKTASQIRCNLEAAEIYGRTGAKIPEIKCYAKAVNGYVVLNDTLAADSILSICDSLVRITPGGEPHLFFARLSKTAVQGSESEIRPFLEANAARNLSKANQYDYVFGYTRIGEYDKATRMLSRIRLDTTARDSLRYLSLEYMINRRQHKDKEALESYLKFTDISERYQLKLTNDDLLFADKRHRIELENLRELRRRDNIIWGATVCVILLLLLSGLLYHRRLIAERDKENLRLKQSALESEKAKMAAEQLTLKETHNRLVAEQAKAVEEQRRREAEAAVLRHEKIQLEDERDRLKNILDEQKLPDSPAKQLIRKRLAMLDGIFAKEISQNSKYTRDSDKIISLIHSDKEKFIKETGDTFRISHPGFMEYLEKLGLLPDEINAVCLYALGLNGKEVGQYIRLKRHYVKVVDIRKKLGIPEDDTTNLAPYIRTLFSRYNTLP